MKQESLFSSQFLSMQKYYRKPCSNVRPRCTCDIQSIVFYGMQLVPLQLLLNYIEYTLRVSLDYGISKHFLCTATEMSLRPPLHIPFLFSIILAYKKSVNLKRFSFHFLKIILGGFFPHTFGKNLEKTQYVECAVFFKKKP